MNQIITIDTALWGLLIGTVLPILVGIVTKATTTSAVKAVLLALLSSATAVGNEIVAAGEFQLKETVLKAALLFLTAVGLHFGLLRPTEVTGSTGATSKIGLK